ncbi:DUF5723 family protein [Pleomorphovibrio marinus]|uniref:DUF5723 family protein n=1 Tax=Pleomorphovibrio marinus TaxID=2164132 RepID=UPI000E0BCC7E|nr:hypothetical protein [Pleomorphovibrio marinus]
MKYYIFLLFLIGCIFQIQAQQGFIGIQNTSRRSLLHVAMNPAEINSLHKKFELNLFAVSASVNNDVLYFSDFFGEEEVVDLAFNRANGPVNIRTEVNVMGPSIGFRAGKWGFGLSTQAIARTDVIDLDANLGRSFTGNTDGDPYLETSLNLPYNQRINVAGWMELGLVAGRELYQDEKHRVSFGTGVRLLMPGAYINAGIDGLRGTLRMDEDGFSLTDASGGLNVNYSRNALDDEMYGLNLSTLSMSNISGVGLDFGITHEWRKQGFVKATSGISLKGLGSLDFGPTQVNNTYSMNVPAGSYFNLDELEGNIEDVEAQLVASGYFTRQSETGYQPQLPRLLTAYTDFRMTKVLYLSVFGQYNMGNPNNNQQIAAQHIFALTPRLKLGGVELYSPWINSQTAGLSGGLGLRVAGFFVGSNSLLTGYLGETKQIDAHVGWSMGFGRYNKKPKKQQLENETTSIN